MVGEVPYIAGKNVYASTESVCSSSNFGRARRMFIFNAAVSANSHVSVKRHARCSRHTHTDCRVMHDKQDVSISRHPVQHRGKLRQLHLQRMKLLAHACARVLQCFDQFASALVASRAEVVLDLLRAAFVRWRRGGDNEEGRPFE